MEFDDLLRRMKRLNVSIKQEGCLGCGVEHNCTTKGCRILREAEELLGALHAVAVRGCELCDVCVGSEPLEACDIDVGCDLCQLDCRCKDCRDGSRFALKDLTEGKDG